MQQPTNSMQNKGITPKELEKKFMKDPKYRELCDEEKDFLKRAKFFGFTKKQAEFLYWEIINK